MHSNNQMTLVLLLVHGGWGYDQEKLLQPFTTLEVLTQGLR